MEDWRGERGKGSCHGRKERGEKSAKLTELGMGVVILSSGVFSFLSAEEKPGRIGNTRILHE